ncbi:MAG: hypothetical protein AAF432_04615 [Planctomycetota bacterium]
MHDPKQPGQPSKIQHQQTSLGAKDPIPVPAEGPVPIVESTNPLMGGKKMIRSIGEKQNRHEDEWARTPNTTGAGAIHVKTFHSKLTDDALRYMDQCINEWLDAHPQYEVKFVNSSVGILTGKLKEPHLICQVWV